MDRSKRSTAVENSFFEIFQRVEQAFEKPPLNSRPEMKKHTLDFLDTLEFRVLDRPNGEGQYVSGIPTKGTYDKGNVDQSKIFAVLDILSTHLGVTEILDDNFGTFPYRGKAMITAGQLILNFTHVGGGNLLDHIPSSERRPLATFLNNSNAFGAYVNGNINKANVFAYSHPIGDDDQFMQEHASHFDQHLKSLADGVEGESNFRYTPLNVIIPDPPQSGSETDTLSRALARVDSSVPGIVTNRFADLIDKHALEYDSKTREIIIYTDRMTHDELANFENDISRRLNPNDITIRRADPMDLILRDERESMAADNSQPESA
jgi:hypothetical protein